MACTWDIFKYMNIPLCKCYIPKQKGTLIWRWNLPCLFVKSWIVSFSCQQPLTLQKALAAHITATIQSNQFSASLTLTYQWIGDPATTPTLVSKVLPFWALYNAVLLILQKELSKHYARSLHSWTGLHGSLPEKLDNSCLCQCHSAFQWILESWVCRLVVQILMQSSFCNGAFVAIHVSLDCHH